MSRDVRCRGCGKVLYSVDGDGVIHVDFKGLSVENPEQITCPHRRFAGIDPDGRAKHVPCGQIVRPLLPRPVAVA